MQCFLTIIELLNTSFESFNLYLTLQVYESSYWEALNGSPVLLSTMLI